MYIYIFQNTQQCIWNGTEMAISLVGFIFSAMRMALSGNTVPENPLQFFKVVPHEIGPKTACADKPNNGFVDGTPLYPPQKCFIPPQELFQMRS